MKKEKFSFLTRLPEETVTVRLKQLFIALAIMSAVTGTGLLMGCSRTIDRRPSASSPISPAQSVRPSATRPSDARALALGKLIFETDTDRLGHITTMYGLPSVTNVCKNCHGSNAKGGRNLPGPDISGIALRFKYNETTFARVLTDGVDSNGKRLSKKMPLFYVTPAPEDAPALWLYLNSLK